jgi:hypothetical protein
MKITLNELRQLVKSVIREEVLLKGSQGALENTFEGWSEMLFNIVKEKVEMGEKPSFRNSQGAFNENKRLISSTIEKSLDNLGVFDKIESQSQEEVEVMQEIMKKYEDYDGFWGVEEILNQEDMSSKDYAIVDMYLLLKRIVISYYFE